MKYVINPACVVMKEFIWLESLYFLVEFKNRKIATTAITGNLLDFFDKRELVHLHIYLNAPFPSITYVGFYCALRFASQAKYSVL